MRYEIKDYRASDGSMLIEFGFCNLGLLKGWRIYIHEDIDYEGKNTSGHATHRLHYKGDTHSCICWKGKIRNIDEAKAIAKLWADCTSLYIKGEGDFDTIARRLMNKK